MNAPDVTEVVNACDAGREGELIFRSVYSELAGCQKAHETPLDFFDGGSAIGRLCKPAPRCRI